MEYIRNSITEAGNYLGLTNPEPTPTGLNTQAPDAGAVSASQLETRKELHDELLETGSQNLQSTKPDSSAKAQLHDELLHTEKSDLIHPVDKSAEIRTEKENYEPIVLESHPELAYETLKSEEPTQETMKSRPEFQRNPVIFTPMYQSGASSEEQSMIRSEPDRIERIEKEQVIREHIHPIVKEEIQPVVYREREQLDVKQVTQMLHETQIQPTRVEERQLPAQYRENVQNRGIIEENIVLPSREVEGTTHTRMVHEPIVNEIIKKTVVEEIQPVVERDIYQPKLVQTQVPIYEKIVEAPIVTREVIGAQQSSYSQVPQGSYSQVPQGSYSQVPQGSYSQVPQGSYSQVPQGSYSQVPQGSYSQVPQGSYSQVSSYPSTSQSASTYTVLSNQNESDVLASRGYGHLGSGQSQSVEYLPTGQVLPSVASTRPAYSYLPHGTGDKRPDFIGTSAQYAVAANGGLPAKTDFVNPLMPQGTNFYPNSAPQTLHRQ